jgi:hypothetical protein
MTQGGTNVNSLDLTLASLAQTANSGAMLYLSQTTLGAAGSGMRIGVTGGVSLTNRILPWAVVGGTELGSYINYTTSAGVTSGGLGALNAAGFAGYDQAPTTVASLTSSATANARVSAFTGTQTLGAGLNLNALNLVTTAAGTVAFTNASDVLNLTAGALLRSGAFPASIGLTAESGSLTTGGTGASVPLYLWNNANTLTINSRILNNPTAGGALQLVAAGASGTTINLASGLNSYGGGTVVNGVTLGLLAGAVLPGGSLTLNGATFTQTLGGTVTAQPAILNGGATLTLVGSNTLSSIEINNIGGTTTPTVTAGTLTLNGGITATSSNLGSTSTIAGTLDFGGASRTLSISPVTINGAAVSPRTPTLIISALIQNAGTLNVNGGGVLQLGSSVSTFTGSLNVNAGGLVLANNSSITSLPNAGLGLVSGATLYTGPLGMGT